MAATVPNIVVIRAHSLGVKGIRTKVEAVAASLGTKYGATWAWNGSNVDFQIAHGIARGIRGTIYVSPTQLQVAVFLPMLMLSLKNTIRDGIAEALDEHLQHS